MNQVSIEAVLYFQYETLAVGSCELILETDCLYFRADYETFAAAEIDINSSRCPLNAFSLGVVYENEVVSITTEQAHIYLQELQSLHQNTIPFQYSEKPHPLIQYWSHNSTKLTHFMVKSRSDWSLIRNSLLTPSKRRLFSWQPPEEERHTQNFRKKGVVSICIHECMLPLALTSSNFLIRSAAKLSSAKVV